jgi:DnaK suppressor protein
MAARKKSSSSTKAKKRPAAGKKAASKKKAASGAPKRKPAAQSKAKVKRKPATKGKSAKRAPTKRTASKKKPAGKKAGVKKPAAKRPAKKKPVSKKAVVKKKTAVKKAAGKKATARKPAVKKAAARKPAPRRKVSPETARADAQRRARLLAGPIHGVEPYLPKKNEPYMSDEQLEHFRQILSNWKRELMEEVDRTVHHMKDEAANFPDPNDRATQESEFGLELRTRDRERKLLRKIDSALQRIEDRSYGFCEETGEEIGLKRLEARPVATLCLEAQERRELAERQFRDRDDRYR